MKLNTLVTLMLSAVIVLVLLSVHMFYFFQIGAATRSQLEDKAMAVARTLAKSPEIQQALRLPPDRAAIQPIAKAVEESNNLLFISITNMDGIRYSHRNPELVGKHFIGPDIEPALRGNENVSVNQGSLAKSLRVFTPVYDAQQRQIGVVAIGISLEAVTDQINQSRWSILWTILIGTFAGAVGTFILVRVLKRILFGLEPYEISTLFEQRQAILNSVKEGVVAMDDQGEVTLVNQAARQLLSDKMGSSVVSTARIYDASVIDQHLQEVLNGGRARRDEELNVNGRLLLSNTVPVRSQGRIIGAITTFRDKTEISQLMQRIDGMVNYVDALRERSHEFMNKLHVILGLLHMKRYDKLEEYILQTAHNYQTDIGTIQSKVKSPVVAGFLLGKINRAKEAGVTLTLADESQIPDTASEEQVAVLITALGNLIENALDAMEGQQEGEIGLLLHYQNGWLSCEVSDDGPGIDPTQLESIFTKGFSTKGDNRGVGLFLARQQIQNLGGDITVESEPGVFTQFFVHIPWDSERNIA